MGAGACRRHQGQAEHQDTWLVIDAEGARNLEEPRGVNAWERLVRTLFNIKTLQRLWATLGHHLNHNISAAARTRVRLGHGTPETPVGGRPGSSLAQEG
jgi:hypothetical protein